MARTITFQPTAPTDFSNGNAMFANALSNMATAFKQGQNTVNNFGQDVRDRNNALLNSVISGINQEDWAKPETQVALNNLIKDMSDNTSNMVDLDTAYKTIDGRSSVLNTRQNNEYTLQENALKHQKMLDEKEATDLFDFGLRVNATATDDPRYNQLVTEFNERFNSSDPTIQRRVSEMSDEKKLKDVQQDTELLKAHFAKRGASEQFNANVLNFANSLSVEADGVLNNPNATDEQRTLAQKNKDRANSMIASLNMSTDTILGSFMKAQTDNRKVQQESAEKAFDQRVREATLKIQEKVANSSVNRNEVQNAVDLVTAQSNLYKAQNGDKSSNRNSDKPVTELEKEAFGLGYTPDVVNKDQVDSVKLSRVLMANIADGDKNDEALYSNQSYRQFLSTPEANLSKNKDAQRLGNNILGFGRTKGQDLIQYLTESKGIPEYMKIAMHKQYANGNFEEFSKMMGLEEVDTVVNRWVEQNKDLKNKQITQSRENRIKHHINLLKKSTGLSGGELLTHLMGFDNNGKYVSNNIPTEVIRVGFTENEQRQYSDYIKKKYPDRFKSKK